jgi:hypothetical protein
MSLDTVSASGGTGSFAAPHSSALLRAWLRESDLGQRLDLPAQRQVDAA